MKGLHATFKVLKTFFSLGIVNMLLLPRQKIKGKLPAEDWIQLFEKVQVLSKHVKMACFFMKRLSISLLILCIFTFIAIFLPYTYIGGLDTSEFLINFTYYALCFLCLVYLLYHLMDSLSVEQRFSYFVFPLMIMLKEEVHPDSKIELQANLGKTMTRANFLKRTTNFKRTSLSYVLKYLVYLYPIIVLSLLVYFLGYAYLFSISSDLYPVLGAFFTATWFLFLWFSDGFAPEYPRIYTKMYKNCWLKFRARLADKSLVDCQIEENIYRIKRLKKNPRNKIKSKYKTKSVENYLLKVALPSQNYKLDTQDDNASAFALRKIPGANRNQIRQKGKRKSKNTVHTPDLQFFLKMVGNAYRQVKQAKT